MEDLPNLKDKTINFPGFQHQEPQTVLKPCLFVHPPSRNKKPRGLYARCPAQTGLDDFGTGYL